MPSYTVICPAHAGQPYQLNEIRGRFDAEGIGDTPVHDQIVADFAHYGCFTFREIPSVGQKIKGAVNKLLGKTAEPDTLPLPESEPDTTAEEA